MFATSNASAQEENSYTKNLIITTWISLENPIAGIKYQNNSSVLGYYVNIKTDLDKFMATAGPSVTVIKDHTYTLVQVHLTDS